MVSSTLLHILRRKDLTTYLDTAAIVQTLNQDISKGSHWREYTTSSPEGRKTVFV